MYKKLIFLAAFVLAFGLALSSNALAGAVQFDFGGDLSATFGAGSLDYYNGATTSNTVSFGTASSFGLPALPGGEATVMSFPAFAPDQGLLLEPASSANGGGEYINQYTMIWDVLIPDVSANWTSLYNTNATNSNDGDFFIRASDGGIGISGMYHGTVNSGQWHRIAVVLDLVAGTMAKYIDGVHVATQGASGVDGRFSMYTTDHGVKTYLLTDENSETNSGYINSYCFTNKALDASTIAEIGGPDADGVGVSAFAKAENPDPPDGAENVIIPLVKWDPGVGAAFHDIYFGTNPTPGAAEFRGRELLVQAMYYHTDGIVPGTTYYWRIDEVESDGTTVHTGNVWSFTAATVTAHSPDPVDGTKYVRTDVVLRWGVGATAITHDVYFGTDETAVADGTGSTFKGNQPDATYTPTGLANDTTYYWRIDEVEDDNTTKHQGAVWRFKTVPQITISDPNLIGWWKYDEGSGTTSIDWSGHGNDATLYGDPEWVEGYMESALYFGGTAYATMDGVADDFTDDDVTMAAWIKTTTTSEGDWYSMNPTSGTQYLLCILDGDIRFYEGGWQPAAGVTVNDGVWHHVAATRENMYVRVYVDGVYKSSASYTSTVTFDTTNRWSIAQEWDGSTASDFYTGAVDDVRLYDTALTAAEIAKVMIGDPQLAFDPDPANKSTPDFEHASILSWSAGEKASQHDVYFGTDRDAVENADSSDTTDVYRGRQLPTSYTPPGDIEWGGGPYYWRIDEYNTDATISEGRIWSFTVADHLIVEDFEDYNDYCDRIFYTWGDGWGHSGEATCGVAPYGGNGTGSTVGYLKEPYAEPTIVSGGLQSMPFEYLNDGSTGKALYSETERTFDSPQDWTRHGVKALTLWFRGYPATASTFNYNPGTDVYTMTVRSGDIWDTSDEFHYVFKRLSGIGSITAKVLSVQNTSGWAKGGVMIRETLDANSPHTMAVMTPSNGVAFQYRGTAGGTSGNVNTTGITAPHWVRLSRSANTFTAEHSTNGSNWETVGSEDIPMGSSMYVGLALTSNNVGAVCKAEFSNVTTTGSVTGQWQSLDIGISSNVAEQLYVAVQDSTGKSAVAEHPDPNAVLSDTWQEWNIDIREFSNVSTQSITKMFIGVGDRNAPKLGGGGMLYLDDIRLYRPRCLPDLIKPDADVDGSCVVDLPDVQILAEDWLLKASDPGSGNLVGWWKFDGNASDSSGSGIHGTAVGNPQYAAGYDGDALDVDGDDHVLLGSSSDLNFGDATDFSVALWIKTSGWQDDAAIISNKDWNSGSNTGWVIAGQGGGSGSWQWNYSGATGSRRDYDPPGPTISDDQWHHLCVAHDRDAYATFYVDGQYQAQVDISGSTGSIDPGHPTVVGTDGVEGAVWAYWFIGLIDDVRIYNDVLTQTEVLYLSGARLRIDLHADGTIDFKDYAVLADSWLDEELWPQP